MVWGKGSFACIINSSGSVTHNSSSGSSSVTHSSSSSSSSRRHVTHVHVLLVMSKHSVLPTPAASRLVNLTTGTSLCHVTDALVRSRYTFWIVPRHVSTSAAAAQNRQCTPVSHTSKVGPSGITCKQGRPIRRNIKCPAASKSALGVHLSVYLLKGHSLRKTCLCPTLVHYYYYYHISVALLLLRLQQYPLLSSALYLLLLHALL